MATKKKPILVSEHPATQFLNTCFHYHFRLLVPNIEFVYEELHNLHLKGKKDRSPLTYLGFNEILSFVEEHNPSVYSNLSKADVNVIVKAFSVALGWKQFKQIYKFQPQLVEELCNIDFTDSKYETISREEIGYLPCFNFYIEQDVKIGDKNYVGFFTYFDELNIVAGEGHIHILFIADPKTLPQKNGIPIKLDYYSIFLLYSYDFFHIHDKSTGKTFQAEIEPKEVLKLLNPVVFNELGEEEALKLISSTTQLITYLCATNADFNRVKKPTKKPDLKRVKITDAEYEVWRLGDVYITPNKKVPARYTDFKGDAYNRDRVIKTEIIDSVEDEVESTDIEYVKAREKGYHVRPHMRKAHWKHYWYGKKDGSEERVKRRKFVSPVFINRTGDEIEMPTRETIQYRF